jgi:tetratricopeptide (TPR) repeat protein
MNAYLQKEDVDKAIEVGEKMVDLAPDFALGLNNLAFAYYAKEDYDKAIGYIDRAMASGFEVHPEFLEKLQPYRKP